MKSTKWKIDPEHSEIRFKVRYLMLSWITGTFDHFVGEIEAPEHHFEAGKIFFWASTQSINTRLGLRDHHLRSVDFFHAEMFPELTFRSRFFTHKQGNQYHLNGDLTIKGITREVDLEVIHEGVLEAHDGGRRAGFEITGQIDRKDFGLNWNAITAAGNMVLADQVKLMMNIQLIQIV
jgi:polyisoprenoid-binding protein YceI